MGSAQREMDTLLSVIAARNKRPRLLLHSCCAPCSSYVLEYLASQFEISVFYYNPNITGAEEYKKRAEELARLIREMPLAKDVRLIEGTYEPERFLEAVKGLEEEPEGGLRCEECFRLRLMEAADAARREGCDYFATTLTISPKKNADTINRIGEEIAEMYGVRYLASDFKKKGGYQRSIELSREYGLYRQDYCGCVFSRRGKEEGKDLV